jgi:hypothetical protein
MQMADDNRSPALCLALVDPLPADTAAVAEWYLTQVQRLDSIAELEKTLKGRSGNLNEFHIDRQNVEVEEKLAQSGQ